MQGGQAFSNGIFGEAGYVANPQFFHHLSAMGFNGLDTDVQLGGDELVLLPSEIN